MPNHLLTFVHMSDTHIHIDPDHTEFHTDFSSRYPVQQLIETINALPMPVDFILHTGDVTHHPDAAEHYQLARDILSQLEKPVYYVPGNHDNVAMMQRHFLNIPEDKIKPHYDHQFEVNGVQVIMLDSHISPEKVNNHNGILEDEQLEWLSAQLLPDDTRPLVVGLHHHALPLHASWLDRLVLVNGEALHERLLAARDRLRGVFYGHIHESVVTVRDGISYYSVQSGWFQTRSWYGGDTPTRGYLQTPGFNLVTITDQDTFVRFRRISL